VVQLAAPPQAAYDYLSRPARWREWHHSSLGAQEHALESLPTGAKFEEDIRTVGFTRHLRWQVLEARPGQRWEATASMDDGSTVRLLYEFAPHESGTRFTRTLDYAVAPVLLRVLNATVGALKVRLESRQALRRLQQHFAGAAR
jgi:uncharacterized protein YndB with AHSA1/START domain